MSLSYYMLYISKKCSKKKFIVFGYFRCNSHCDIQVPGGKQRDNNTRCLWGEGEMEQIKKPGPLLEQNKIS